MHINRLRLLGFKSFVEPTELIIEHGLTGVVGPNGCGKSNLLEALRWVMGETSHKSMRAAAMDDVIFSGTTNRPARNTAEVTIFIDNRARTAPAEFNKHDVIEITRRIEREEGSSYRVNGQDSRARDVKILFEDAATGARSPALVRQGQIGEIVNAKPEQRRRVLEDAAGVAGLHSRRHEAELRLKAAEANLARLSDILAQLGTQVEGLKRQARQVKRYKELSAEIRRAEAMLLHLHWAEAQAHVTAEESALAQSLSVLGEATAAEAQALRQEAEIADTIPPLREEEAKRAAAVARLRIEQNTLERETERAVDRQQELEGRIGQFDKDLARERNLVAEARQIIQRLDAELAAVKEADAKSDAASGAEAAALADAEHKLDAADNKLLDLTHRASELRTRKQHLASRLGEWQQQAGKLERQLTALEAQHREISARAPDAVKLTETQELEQHLAEELIEIEAQATEAENEARAAAADAKQKREAARLAELAAKELSTELATLSKLLMPVHEGGHPPVLDQIQVAAGYEVALGAALGDDLDAPIAAEASVHWRLIDPISSDEPLPVEAEPLITKVEGPPELTRRLQQVGIVERDLGPQLQPVLKPGQRLVSCAGDLWRWDGFVAAAEAPTAAAQRLAERNRLKELSAREAAARTAMTASSTAAAEAAESHKKFEDEERRLRQLWRDTQGRLAKTRESLVAIEKAARETESRLAALSEAKSAALERLGDTRLQIEETEVAIAAIDEMESTPEAELATAQQEARAARDEVSELRARLASAEREQQARAERLKTAAAEHERWTARCESAEEHIVTLDARMTEAREELEELSHLLPLVEDKRHALMDQLAVAERDHKAASDGVAAAENGLREASRALKAAQSAVASGREGRARAEARLEAARQRRSEEVAKIRDQLGVAPEASLELAEAKPGAPLPALGEVDKHLTRLKADRERLGGVNLQADEELSVVLAQSESLDSEKSDVEAGIAKLRGGIGQLNKEARKRLQQAFDEVNGHFQKLFTTLFGGGEARLEMVESEDPLESGLEIIAKPPGKKPATLSLLSGGEQTLTALSLIFAVFLTNPSPICVLDEVDAPLDDANVDRFCTLMEHMAKDTETRFLVITHHPMTMARMDRLFGVTMGEKGVSQLVSVDLATAERFIEAKAS